VIAFTDWAKDILHKSQTAASRFNPNVKIRLSRVRGSVQAVLAEDSEASDETVDVDGMTLYVESGLEGLLDVEEPHDRLVLKPSGSPPNQRGSH
jgi:hypothetical protein